MLELGIKALHEMKDAEKVLRDVDSMLHDLLSKKRYGSIKAIQTVLEALRIRAESEGRKTVEEFVRGLKECLWHEGSGVDMVSAIIKSSLDGVRRHGNHEQSVPQTPGAMRHQHFRQASETAYPARLAA